MTSFDRNGFVVEIRRGNGSPKFLPLTPGATVSPMSIGMLGDFRLEADGVLDVHGYLYFDGANLFVQSSDGHHLIRVNGKPIGSEWTPVSPPCTLAIGDARLVYCPASQASAIAATAPPVSRPAAGRAHRPQSTAPAFDESAPTIADGRYEYDDAVATQKTRAPDDEATGSIPIPPAPRGMPPPGDDDHETTRALPLPVMPASFPRPPAPPPPPHRLHAMGGHQQHIATPGPIAAPPAALVVAEKKKPLVVLKEQWKQASLPKKAIALLLPLAFVMVIFGLDDKEPAEQPTATAPSASASAPKTDKSDKTVKSDKTAKAKPTQPDEPENLDPTPTKPTPTAAPAPTHAPKKTPKETDKTAERAAVDAVSAGAWDTAAKAYEDLAKQHPENPAYKEAARILRAKAKK